MTYPAAVDPNFIVITHAPCEGQEKRRHFIRHRVMLNYHSQKKQGRKQAKFKAKGSAEEECADLDTQSASKASSSGHETLRRSTRSRGISHITPAVHTTASSIVRPPSSLDLLKPKYFSDSRDRHSAGVIMRFLCGQVMKGVCGFRGLVFVHGNFQAVHNMTVNEKENPLVECRNLLREHSTPEGRVDLNRSELWEGIFEKQEGIYTNCANFSKWKLLSAAQAMTMFVLLRLSYGTNHPAFPDSDIALLYSLGKAFKLLQDQYITRQDLNSPPRETLDDWQNFIFRESTIRTSMVYFILTLVVSMEFGLACDQPEDWHLEEIPLPAGKVVWDATANGEWKRAISCKAMGSVLTFGDLVKMYQGGGGERCESVQRNKIERWQEEVDEFGLIVSIAAELSAR